MQFQNNLDPLTILHIFLPNENKFPITRIVISQAPCKRKYHKEWGGKKIKKRKLGSQSSCVVVA